MMGALFCLEHNSVCDALAAANPTWDDEELFQRARLVVSRADRQDPHGGVDAGHPRPPHHRGATARQLVRDRGSEDPRHLRPDQLQRTSISGITGRSGGPLRRAVLADRGVLDRLPHAPADSRRLRDPGLADRRGRGRVHAARTERRRRARRCWPRQIWSNLFYIVRHVASRRDRAAELPEVPAGVPATRTAATPTLRPPTSCVPASSAYPATTSSADCCTSNRRTTSPT